MAATDHFSTLSFLMRGNQTNTDSVSIDVWLTMVMDPELGVLHRGFLASTLIACLLTLFIGLVQFVHVYKFISVIRLKSNMYYLIFLNPISSLCCFFGMISPRNAAFMYGVILSYHMLAIRIALDVMFNINGGRVCLSKMLTLNNERIRFSFFPFCLFQRCLPTFAPSVTNIARFEMVVSQTCIVRIVLMIIDTCVYREIGTLNSVWFFFSHSATVVSTMVALYFSYAISKVNRENSKRFRFNHLFSMVDWSQTLITFQKTAFDLLSFLEFYPTSIFPKHLLDMHFTESIYILFFLYSLEVLVMSLLISFFMRPSKSYIFDTYTGPRSSPPPRYMYLDDSDEGLLPAVMEADSAHVASVPEVEAPPAAVQSTATTGAENQATTRAPTISAETKQGGTVSAVGPETAQRALESTNSIGKKAVIPTAEVDDGGYENMSSKSARSLNKVLQEEGKAADDFFKLPSQVEPTAPPLQ